MFLASTSIEEFWNKDDELLFLGRWCTRNLAPNELQRLRYKILPNPWNDRDRLYESIAYLDRFSETALVQLSERLNQFHGVKLDLKYWRVLVSPWIVHYLHVLYDRYTILTDAFAKFPQLETLLLAPESFQRLPDTDTFTSACSHDPYNLQLFSALIRAMGYRFPGRHYDSPRPVTHARKTLTVALKELFLLGEAALLKSIAKDDAIAMYSMYWRRPHLWKLAVGSGFRFFPMALPRIEINCGESPLDTRAREDIASIPSQSAFEQIFWRQFAADLPEAYLENYESIRQTMSRRGFPSALISDSSWYFDEPFKFFAAEAYRAGKRLLVSQHGGGYGISRYTPAELHEARVADAYLVWGWADSKPRHHNLPSPQLIKKRRGVKTSSSILFISTANPLYLAYRFHSSPLGDQWSEYFEWQLRFLKEMPDRKRVVYRPYPADFGFNITAQLKAAYPEVQVHHGRLWHELIRSRLAVIDHCGTTFLETLAANIPTIMYWDPKRWEVREEAMPYVQRLVECGILWPTPEDAARAVARVYDDIQAWWESKELQDARRTFTTRFALHSENWVQAWKNLK